MYLWILDTRHTGEGGEFQHKEEENLPRTPLTSQLNTWYLDSNWWGLGYSCRCGKVNQKLSFLSTPSKERHMAWFWNNQQFPLLDCLFHFTFPCRTFHHAIVSTPRCSLTFPTEISQLLSSLGFSLQQFPLPPSASNSPGRRWQGPAAVPAPESLRNNSSWLQPSNLRSWHVNCAWAEHQQGNCNKKKRKKCHEHPCSQFLILFYFPPCPEWKRRILYFVKHLETDFIDALDTKEKY